MDWKKHCPQTDGDIRNLQCVCVCFFFFHGSLHQVLFVHMVFWTVSKLSDMMKTENKQFVEKILQQKPTDHQERNITMPYTHECHFCHGKKKINKTFKALQTGKPRSSWRLLLCFSRPQEFYLVKTFCCFFFFLGFWVDLLLLLIFCCLADFYISF